MGYSYVHTHMQQWCDTVVNKEPSAHSVLSSCQKPQGLGQLDW